MSRLRHAKGSPKMAGAFSGVHRKDVAEHPSKGIRPFKPDEEKKCGGPAKRMDGGSCKSKLGRKRGGSVKKKSDGGNVTTLGKTTPSDPPDTYDTLQKSSQKYLQSKPYLRARELQGPLDQIGTWGVHPSYEWHDEARKSGPKAEDRLGRARGGKVDTPDRGTKYGSHVQPVPMSGTKSGYGGKSAFGKGHIEDSVSSENLKDGGKVAWLHKKHGGKLTYQERKSLKSSSFVFPGERKYPIEDESHARNALARVSQHGSSSEKAKVRSAVHRKYPSIGQKQKG